MVKYNFGGVIALPSRTWTARAKVVEFVAKQLNVPFFLDFLVWRQVPPKRQGELLNNDQRRYNVNRKMTMNNSIKIPHDPILLLDDYIGSGATIMEAARVLRKEKYLTKAIFPFTIAAIKWKLGQPGMI